jgi:diacylglycerol kinase
MNQNKSGLKKRIKSFSYAFTGIYELVKSEPNAQIHFLATIIAVSAGFICSISASEWCIIIIAIAIVWMAEGFNTVAEKFCNHVIPEYNETARIIKDVAAGSVLICAIAAFIIGLIIFVPKIF